MGPRWRVEVGHKPEKRVEGEDDETMERVALTKRMMRVCQQQEALVLVGRTMRPWLSEWG